MTDGAGCQTIIKDHSPPCCTTCAPVLGFPQLPAAPTHVAIGLVSEGKNSINKTRPSTRYTMLQQRHRDGVDHLFLSLPLSPCHMSIWAANVQYIGLSFIQFKAPSLALCNEAVTRLVLVYCPRCLLSNQLASVSLPSGTSGARWSGCHFCRRRNTRKALHQQTAFMLNQESKWLFGLV